MGGFGWQELLIILAIVALIFGVGKVADVGPALGKAISGFRKEMKEPDKDAEPTVEKDETEEQK
jgi:sec-independent protein translocase protein TatA